MNFSFIHGEKKNISQEVGDKCWISLSQQPTKSKPREK